jgi:hypothetical protein
MDLGLTTTALACALGVGRAVHKRSDLTLPCMLAAAWGTSLGLAAAKAQMATFIFSAAALNIMIAGIALVLVTRDNSRVDAKITGGFSMAIMPAHWVMSVTTGAPDWTLYAYSCNAVFIVQCLVAGGWLNGLGRCLAGFFARLRPVHRLRGGSR